MADSLTTNYGWVMPQDQSSSDTWGVKLNGNLQAIDSQVWTNTQAGQNVTVLSTASVAATYTFGNSLAPAGQQMRWQWQMDTTPESGTTTGSNLNLLAYDNTGVALAPAATFSRTAGATFNAPVTFTQPTTFAGNQTLSSSSINLHGGVVGAGTPILYFSSTSDINDGANVVWGEIVTTPNEMDIVGPGQLLAGIMRPGALVRLTPDTLNGHGGGVSIIGLGVQAGLTINGDNGAWFKIASTAITAYDAANPGASLGSMSFSSAATTGFAVGSGGNQLSLTNTGFTVNVNAFKPGGGSWAATSDARIKTVEGAYMSGLAAVLALRPVEYRYKSDPAVLRVGLVAQEVEDVMPEMVTKGDGEIDGEKVNDLRTLDTTALVFALVNAVRELTAEIDVLKAKLT